MRFFKKLEYVWVWEVSSASNIFNGYQNHAFPYLLKSKHFLRSVFKGVFKPQLKLAFCVCILATSYGCLDFVKSLQV